MWTNTGDEPKMLERIPIIRQVNAYKQVKKNVRNFLRSARDNREDEKLHNRYCRYATSALSKFESENFMYVHKTGSLRDKISEERGIRDLF